MTRSLSGGADIPQPSPAAIGEGASGVRPIFIHAKPQHSKRIAMRHNAAIRNLVQVMR